VPTLPKHGAKGGSKAETFLSRHRSGCGVRTAPTPVRTEPYESSSGKGMDSGKGGVEERANARTLREIALAEGGPVAAFAGSKR
jgi:hypothetical protein